MDNYNEVQAVATDVIKRTMQAGESSNGAGSFWNKTPLYHVNKGMHHVLNVWHRQDVETREIDAPHLKEIENAITRLILALVVHRKNNPEKPYETPPESD
jgi:hypothetical protein